MSQEIAVRYVTLAVETSGLARQIARAFGPGAQIGQRAGRHIGEAMHKGFASAKPVNLDQLTARAQDSQKRLTATVEDASRKRRAASAQVRIAEERLQEVMSSGAAKSSQVLAARERLTRAQERYIDVSRKGVTEIGASSEALRGAKRALNDAQTALNEAKTASDTAGKSFAGFGGRLRAALSGTHAKAFEPVKKSAATAGAGAASGFVSRFSTVQGPMSGLGHAAGTQYSGALTGAVRRGIAPLPGLLAGVLGVRGVLGLFSAGMNRLTSLQRAEILFRNLGLSAADTKRQMTDIEGIVTGTSVSMDEAAKSASMLMQAGVQAGAPLNDSIKALANVSAVAGGAAGDIGLVMMQIKASGRLLANDANQLASRGVNIYGYLAENLGKSYAEVRSMGEAGQISYEMVIDAINAKSGELAKEMGQTLPAKAQILTTSLAKLVANGLEPIQPVLKDVLTSLTTFVKDAAPNVKNFFTWLFGDSASARTVQILTAAFAGAVAVFGALKLAVGALVLPFKLATSALTAMNLAWRANPIGLIVTALGALVAAAIWAYENVDWFRAGVDTVFAAVGQACQWLYEGIIKPVWEGIVTAVKAVVDFFTGTVAPGITAALEGVGQVFTWLYQNVVEPIWTGIRVAFAVGYAVVKGVIDILVWIIQTILAPVFKWLYENVIKPVWDALGTTITWVWENVVSPAFKAIGWFIENVLAPVFKWLYENVIQPVWDSFGNKITWVWENVVLPAFKAIIGFIGKTMPEAWQSGVDTITKIWDGIKDAVREPIRFVVDVIYNNGFRKNFNDIAKPLGIGELPRWELGFAAGGWTGPGSMWTPAGIVHADEYVIRKSSRRKFEEQHPGFLDYINRHGRLPGPDGHGWAAAPTSLPGQAAYLATSVASAASRTGQVGIETSALRDFDPANVIKGWQNVSALRVGQTGTPQVNIRLAPMSVPGWGQGGWGWTDSSGSVTLNSASSLLSQPMATRRAVAIHEIGHALGLPHITSQASIMHPAVATAKWPTDLDIRMMRNLYGAPGEGVRAWGDPGDGGIDIMGFIAERILGPIKAAWDHMTQHWAGVNLAHIPISGITRFRDGFVEWVKNALAPVTGFVGDTVKNVGSSVQLTAWMTEALLATGQPLTALPVGIKRALQESSGDPAAVNTWDINAKRGTPSKGLMQLIDPTFAAYKDPGRENIWDPVHNIIASIRYTLARYGSLEAGWGRPGGYALGGRVTPTLFDQGGILRAEGPQWIEHRRRDPDMVLTSRQWEAMYKIARQGRGSAGVNIGAVYGLDAEEVARRIKERQAQREALYV